MPVAVTARTVGQVFVEAAKLCGYVLAEGTATAGTGTTLTDANLMQTPTAQSRTVVGNYIYIFAGTSAGTAKEVTSYAVNAFTWIGSVTSPSTDSQWVLLRRHPQDIIDAMAAATRAAAWKQAQPLLCEYLATNNYLLHYGDMEEWTSGTSSAPDGWTLAGAGAAITQSTVNPHGLYSALLTPAAAILTLTYTASIEQLRMLDGTSLTLRGYLGEAVAGDGVVRVTVRNAAGTSTNTDRTGTYEYNTSGFERLEDISTTSISVPDPVTQVVVQVRIAANAGAARVDDLMLLGPTLYEYELPASWVAMQGIIYLESDHHSGKFPTAIYHGGGFHVIPGTGTPSVRARLVLHKAYSSGRHLRIMAYRRPTVVTGTTSNVEPNPEWLALATAARLLKTERSPNESTGNRLAVVSQELAAMERSASPMLGAPGLIRLLRV